MEKETKKNNEPQQKSFAQSLFSTKGILIVCALLMGYWLFLGGDKKEELPQVSDQPKKTLVGVSDSLNQEAVDRLGVDLTENLDPKLIPALVQQAMKETAEAGVQGEEFVQALINKISNKIRDISTIDLNNDGIADPVLVVPQNISEGGENMQLSIRVPDPAEVKTLPSGSDAEAWGDIANNKSIEVMTASAVKQDDQNMMLQSSPNPQMYSGTHPPYYHHYSPLTSMLMTSVMMGWMLSPGFYGPGMGYGNYGASPRTTAAVNQNRNRTTSNLQAARGSSSAALNSKGQSVATNNFKKVPPKSLNQIKSTQFKSRNTQKAAAAGGFGKSAATAPKQSVRPQSSPRKSFGRSSSGFGRRSGGFGGGRRR